MNVTAIDWVILVVTFLVFLGMAIYINTHVKSVADFLVSGRKVRMWLGMGAGIAGEIGLVTIASICEQGYMRGFSFVLLGILSMLILVPLFGFFGFGIERFRATKAMSVPQYIEMRYSKRLRVLTGILNSLAGVLQMSIFPIVGAAFVKALIHAPDSVAVGPLELQSTWIIMGVLLSCVVLFTFFGGYITLIVTNFFQMIIIVGSLYWVFFLVLGKIGLQNFWSGLEKLKGLEGVYPFTVGSEYGVFYFVWMMTMSILLQFSYGPYLQKYASMDRPKTVSRSYLLGTLFSNGRTFIILGLGVAALVATGAKTPEGMNPIAWKSIATPAYLSSVVPPVLMGVLLAGLLFADVSTTDQYILTWSTSIVNDCICPFKKKPFSIKGHIRAVKAVIFALCVLFFVNGMLYKPTMPIWEYLWLCANIIGGTGIAVLFGMYWRRASTAGAYGAVLVSLVLPLADIIARRVCLDRGVVFPFEPKITGFGTYVAAVAAMVILSLGSKGKTKYWDLGKTVEEMNRAS